MTENCITKWKHVVKVTDLKSHVIQILSRGNIIDTGVVPLGVSVPTILQITAAMVPYFRLVGYYYNEIGDIIADSIWVDVKDECGIDVKVGEYESSGCARRDSK